MTDNEMAREITEKGLEEYSSSWKKANKKGDAGRPFRECMSEAITQALRSVREEEREACAEIAQKFLPLMNIQDIICESNLKQADVTARAIRNRMKERP